MSKKRENSNSELMLVKQHLSKVLEEHGHAILKLKASEEKFKTVADYTYNWEYWLCPKGTVLYNSPSCKGLTGYDKDEFHRDPELFSPSSTRKIKADTSTIGNAVAIPPLIHLIYASEL